MFFFRIGQHGGEVGSVVWVKQLDDLDQSNHLKGSDCQLLLLITDCQRNVIKNVQTNGV